MSPLVYREDEVDLVLVPIRLNGRDGALQLVDAAGRDDDDEDLIDLADADDIATFEDRDVATAWVADLILAAGAAGLDLGPITAAAEVAREGQAAEGAS